MLYGRTRYHSTCDGRSTLLSTSIICLLAFMLRTNAQSSIDLSATVAGSTPLLTISTISTQASFLTANPLPSMTTSFTASTSSNATTSSPTQRPTEFVPPELFAGASRADPDSVRKETVFNYYFLFLAVFGLLIAGGLWWLHRRRKLRKEQMRLGGQNALAQDLDGWISTRRWMHGAWRHNQTAAFIRREEGLNEHGEAPPPYQPKNEAVVSHEGPEQDRDATSGLTIPMRTLSREEVGGSRPPEYDETAPLATNTSVRPHTSNSRSALTDTVDMQPRAQPDNIENGENPPLNSPRDVPN